MQRLFLFLVLSGFLTVLAYAQQTIDEGAVKKPAEIVSSRTEFSETIYNNDGTRTTKIYSGRKYYRDGDKYNIVDLSEKTEIKGDFTHAVKAGLYTYRFNRVDKSKGCSLIKENYYVTYYPAGDRTGKVSSVIPTAEGIKESITFTSDANSSVSWIVKTNANILLFDGELTFSDSTGTFLFMIPKAKAFDSDGIDIPVTVSLKADTLTYTLKIPEKISWPVTLDPSTTITAQMDGWINNSDNTYSTARDAESGTAVSDYLEVGQYYGVPDYFVNRSFLTFPIPVLWSVSACSLYVNGRTDNSTTDFLIYIHGANSYGPTLNNNDFPMFHGRNTGQSHNGTVLNDTWNSSSYSSDWNTIIFNAAGCDSILASMGDTLRIALISGEDYDNSTPADNERLQFENSSHATDKPYLSITYYATESDPSNLVVTPLNASTITAAWLDSSLTETNYKIINMADTTVLKTVAANVESTDVSGLNPNTLYKIAVRVYGGTLDGHYSNTDSTYTDANVPGKPIVFHTGGNVYDVSGNGNHGTNHNTTYNTSTGDNSYGSYLYNGTDAYIKCDNDASLNFQTTDFSLSTWFKCSNTGTIAPIIGKYSDNSGYLIWCRDDGNFDGAVHVQSQQYSGGWQRRTSLTDSKGWNDNNWHHIVTTFNGNTPLIYIDGSLQSTNPDSTGSRPDVDNTGDFILGNFSTYFFHGNIDDVRIYHRILSAGEADSLCQGNSISSDSLKLQLSFDLPNSLLHFVINPNGNPSYTRFAVQDSVTGYYVDPTAEPDTLRAPPLGDWGWRTYIQWGETSGDTLGVIQPDSLYVLRVKAKKESL